MITGRRTVFWLGYAILAGAALCSSVSLIGLFPSHGINFWFAFDSVHYTFISRPVTLLGSVLPYLAYISLAIVVGLQRRFEIWVSVVIAAVGLFLIYKVGDLVLWIPMEGQHDGLIGWPEPVIMFVGAVAVSRLGTLLSAQPATDAAIGSGSAIAPPASPITAEPNNGPQQPSSPIPQNANVTREPVLSKQERRLGTDHITRPPDLFQCFGRVDAGSDGRRLNALRCRPAYLSRVDSFCAADPPLLLNRAVAWAYFINRLLPEKAARRRYRGGRPRSGKRAATLYRRTSVGPAGRGRSHRPNDDTFTAFIRSAVSQRLRCTGATTADGMSMTATIPRRRAKIFVSNFSSKATPTTSW